MGNVFEGKTYVKGSHKTIQPRVASNIEAYKTQQRISSSSNIHSVLSFTKGKSEHVMGRKTVKKLIDDIAHINE
jgi:hypothetical protein